MKFLQTTFATLCVVLLGGFVILNFAVLFEQQDKAEKYKTPTFEHAYDAENEVKQFKSLSVMENGK